MAWRLFRGTSRVAAAVLTFLREIADENAYRRHLAAHGLPHSGQQWRRFCDARLREKHQRPRCC